MFLIYIDNPTNDILLGVFSSIVVKSFLHLGIILALLFCKKFCPTLQYLLSRIIPQ